MSILKMIVFVVDINYLIKLLCNYSLTFNCSNYHLRLPFAITFTINLENINTFGGWGLTLVAYENKAFLCLPFEIDPTNTFEHILPYWKKNTYTLSFKSNRLWLSLSNSLDKSTNVVPTFLSLSRACFNFFNHILQGVLCVGVSAKSC